MRQARRHPRAALKLGMLAARHPRRTRTVLRTLSMTQRIASSAAELDLHLAQRSAAKARRRRRMRRAAIGASAVAAAGTYAAWQRMTGSRTA